MHFLKKFSFFMIFCTVLLLTACSDETIIEGTVHTLDDLPGKNIGVLANSQADLYATDLELPSGEEAPSVIIRYHSLNQAVEDLKTGILDCIIMDASPAENYCSENEHLAVLEEVFSWQEYSICLGTSQTDLADTLNQTLALLEENGTLKEISDRYITTEDVSSDTSSPENITGYAEDFDSETDSADFSGNPDAGETDSVRDGKLLRAATSSGFQPYVYYDENGELTGMDIDLACAVASQLGMEIQITDMDYESLFTSVADGTADFAIAGITPSDDLMDTCIFTDSYTTACQVVLVRE